MTRVVGVDGAPDGWVIADPDARTLAGIASLSALTDVTLAAVDIPLAFPRGTEGREAERAARRVLGRRGASMFSTPPRAVFDAEDYAEACAVARSLTGGAISRQAWGLRAKIHDALVALDEGIPLVEAHPETAFAVMGDGPCTWAKTTWEGFRERTDLLTSEGLDPATFSGSTGKAAPHDVLDAIAAAWVARRCARGTARRFGGEDPIWA